MEVNGQEVNLLKFYTSRWSLKFLATRIALTTSITMILITGTCIVIGLSTLFSLGIGAIIAYARVMKKLREFKQDAVWATVVFGGKLFIFVPKQRHNVRTTMVADTVEPGIEAVESMITFDFPGYGWAKREPTMTVQKSGTPDIDHTPPAMILMAGVMSIM